jgi:hypothetical protein
LRTQDFGPGAHPVDRGLDEAFGYLGTDDMIDRAVHEAGNVTAPGLFCRIAQDVGR